MTGTSRAVVYKGKRKFVYRKKWSSLSVWLHAACHDKASNHFRYDIPITLDLEDE